MMVGGRRGQVTAKLQRILFLADARTSFIIPGLDTDTTDLSLGDVVPTCQPRRRSSTLDRNTLRYLTRYICICDRPTVVWEESDAERDTDATDLSLGDVVATYQPRRSSTLDRSTLHYLTPNICICDHPTVAWKENDAETCCVNVLVMNGEFVTCMLRYPIEAALDRYILWIGCQSGNLYYANKVSSVNSAVVIAEAEDAMLGTIAFSQIVQGIEARDVLCLKAREDLKVLECIDIVKGSGGWKMALLRVVFVAKRSKNKEKFEMCYCKDLMTIISWGYKISEMKDGNAVGDESYEIVD